MDELISRNALLREIMGRPPEAHYPDYYAAIVQQIPAVCSCDVLKEAPSYETIEIEVKKKMEHVITFRAEATLCFENTNENFLGSETIDEFREKATPLFEEALMEAHSKSGKANFNVSNVKVFQLE